jgi:hypothetical protein
VALRTASTRSLPIRVVAAVVLVTATAIPAQATAPAAKPLKPHFSNAVAMDVSPRLSTLAARQKPSHVDTSVLASRDRALTSTPDNGFTGAGGVQSPSADADIPAPQVNFNGLRNEDNFNLLGLRVNPPDPNGEVGPNHYVEMVNLAFAIYSKTGTLLLGPVETGTLWDDFAVEDCTDPSGDPVVLYDQFVDRWILTQFTTRGPEYFNCVAISTTGDPTGTYYRYAFSTGLNFPDYPKYGVWTDSYVITTREFGPTDEYGIGVYALEKNKMVNGLPARAVSFFIDGNDPDMLPLVGDGLLPADIDGKRKPLTGTAIPIIGSQDDNFVYGAEFDALNVWDLLVKWRSTPIATLALNTQLDIDPIDTVYPCVPPPPGEQDRNCLPQPGITNPSQYLDNLVSRQRPIFRLAYRSFKDHESLVTVQNVEALPNVTGQRWYEVRRVGGDYSLYQEGTLAGNDVHRWMGSAAMDKKGNIALGYSVVNATDVYPGIRYTGRLAGDPLGEITLGEGTIIDGIGVQTTINSRWGDYTDLTVDPTDDCTFWYVNEWYPVSGTTADGRPWVTRIASFKLPGC